MRVLALDISTSAGWALLEGENGVIPKILDSGTIVNPDGIKSMGSYPWNFLASADRLSWLLFELVQKHHQDGMIVVIEETNMGRNRYSQKILEFLHCLTLRYLGQGGLGCEVKYINTSDWRKVLGIHMTKVDKARNVKVKRLKRINTTESKAKLKEAGLRGKMTKKHLAIRWANQTYGLELRPKDDDIADALALGTSYYVGVGICDGTNQKRGK